ncbi:PilZ domain-containing protein [Sporosarcina sp. ACRSL]|uniref:PilZ domain-containing protein n=1 Tax=Sporosarcina sp. ACRSL TaxID=2918215 RepID=UPI001EF3FEF9|nr:PilZ domain-containing protein [Sporosarcina sp. ACRSL]MCG7344388.1 PilZ domain-containing protein [Sporosarcina sp. ACRSL]
MLYKRHEYFRHSFGIPPKATFRIVVGEDMNESNPGDCLLLDISPGGTKIATDFNLPIEKGPVFMRLHFTLFETPIDIEGKIVWKKQSTGGFQYGIDFVENPSISNLIIDELKLRRRSEVVQTDGKKS